MSRNLGWLAVPALAIAFFLAGCADASNPATPDGAIVGRSGLWNYSPSVMQTGDLQQFWWCGAGQNPALPAHVSDTILYQSIDTVTHVAGAPQVVLAETPGSWDALYTCNPRLKNPYPEVAASITTSGWTSK